jgi:serine/threonine protein kinase
VVVKELYEQEMSEEDRKSSMNEIQVLSMLRHPNIISYFDSFSVEEWAGGTEIADGTLSCSASGASLMIVMEYADGI